jgi:uncharacterized OB-fold protein
MSDVSTAGLQPLASCIHLGDDGHPYLQGFQCSSCREVYLEHRRGCPKCAAVNSLQPARLSEQGKLFSFTIVHRSFPQIKTPFISVVVELEGGGFIKGNLEGVDPVPAQVRFNMPVRVRFDQLVSGSGKPDLLRYYFVPMEASRE